METFMLLDCPQTPAKTWGSRGGWFLSLYYIRCLDRSSKEEENTSWPSLEHIAMIGFVWCVGVKASTLLPQRYPVFPSRPGFTLARLLARPTSSVKRILAGTGRFVESLGYSIGCIWSRSWARSGGSGVSDDLDQGCFRAC